MSQQNVEIVKRAFEAYGRGDLSAALTSYDDDIVYNPAEEAPIHGREGVLAYIRRWEEPWHDYELETEEFIDAGDCVVVTIHVRGRGAASGVEVDARSHQVHTLRDGKLVRMDEYLERDDALEAAGLREQAMSQENVETVRLAYERLNRGDVDGVVELCDDEVRIDMTERVFNPDTYSGHDGIRRFYEGVKDAWESYRWNVEATHVAGDSVVALLHCQGQSREGGPGVDWRVAWLWKLRRGRPVFVRFYRHQGDALKAAGLSE